MHEYPSSPTRHVRLGWYLYRIGYECCGFQTFCWSLPNRWWIHQSSSSHPSLRNLHLDLLIFQQPNFFCHFLVLLTFEHLNSLMLAAYDNLVWCDLEFHSDGRSAEFSDSSVTLGVISLYPWFDRWLFMRLSHKPLVSHILLLLWLHFLSIRGSYNRFFGFYKLYFLGDIGSQTTLSSISQSGSIGERFFMRKYFIKLL